MRYFAIISLNNFEFLSPKYVWLKLVQWNKDEHVKSLRQLRRWHTAEKNDQKSTQGFLEIFFGHQAYFAIL